MEGTTADLEAPVVLIVSFAVTAFVPVIIAGWATEHVGGSVAPAGLEVSEQVRVTAPVNPPVGVMVIVAVVEPPALTPAAVLLLNLKGVWLVDP